MVYITKDMTWLEDLNITIFFRKHAFQITFSMSWMFIRRYRKLKTTITNIIFFVTLVFSLVQIPPSTYITIHSTLKSSLHLQLENTSKRFYYLENVEIPELFVKLSFFLIFIDLGSSVFTLSINWNGQHGPKYTKGLLSTRKLIIFGKIYIIGIKLGSRGSCLFDWPSRSQLFKSGRTSSITNAFVQMDVLIKECIVCV